MLDQTVEVNGVRCGRVATQERDALLLEKLYWLQDRLERCFWKLELQYGYRAAQERFVVIKRRFYRWVCQWKAVNCG